MTSLTDIMGSDDFVSVLLWSLAVVFVVVGLAGVVLPALPGTWLIFVGLLLAAWADGFAHVGVWPLIVIGVIAAASYFVDFLAPALGAQKLGASKRAMVGAALGTLGGLVFGLPGLLVGPFIGAVAGELTMHREWKQVGRAGVAAWIGFVIGTAVKVGIAFVMIAIFAIAWLAL